MTGRVHRAVAALVGVALVGAAGPASAAGAASVRDTVGSVAAGPAAHYDHVFVIVEENHGFTDVIGNPAAPNLNQLASRYGLATNYFGITHPSEPNYVALLGGSTFGVVNDNPYYLNRVNRPSLVSQLDRAGLPWKAYLQGLPHPGYQGICYPAFCNGTPDKDPLYVSKHNPIPNFTTSWNRRDWSRQVPASELGADLRSGHVPSFGLIVPDECHDQHGDPPYCVDSGTPGDPQDQRLVATGDQYLGRTVSSITHARFWARGNNAIAIVYDEGDNSAGCCGTTPGGGKAATVVITSHGPRGLTDARPYNHYSLLKTIQHNFGLGCLAHTCADSVSMMSPLWRVTGSPADATSVAAVPNYTTPTPSPIEPVSRTSEHSSRGGWTVQPAPRRGSGDNSFGAVSAAGPRNIWAVGNYLPDTSTSNPDATLALAAHYNGRRWVSTPVPNVGPNFTTLFGVAALDREAWAVGDALDPHFHARSIAEHWNGTRWQVSFVPRLTGRQDMLFGAAATARHDVWAVGQQQDTGGRFHTLAEHFNGRRWTRVPTPDPGAAGDSLYAVAASSPHDVWAVGQRSGPGGDRPLIEHYDGHQWRVVRTVGTPNANGLLDAVTTSSGQVWVAGQTDDATHRGRPLLGHLARGRISLSTLTSIADFTNLNGVAIDAHGTAWASGTVFDPTGTFDGTPGGVQQTLILRHDPTGWHRVQAPSPGSADRVLGGMVATGHELLTVGYFKTPHGRQPLIEYHHIS